MTSLSDIKFRSDLVITQQAATGQNFFVVKDPATERFFRLKEPEYFIAQQLDGATPPDVIQQRVESRFGSSLSQESLKRFIENLLQVGLLEVKGTQFGPSQQRGRVRGNVFSLRLKALDPDRFFDGLISKVRFFYTPYFLALSALLILFAFGIIMANWDEIGRDLLHIYRLETLFLVWLTIILVTTAHEFAHGLTCKYFSGKVHELGFLLLYFMPAFYCNVSDAWLFPEKAKRLWVTFAGGYFELFLWAVATLTWRVMDPATAFGYAALVVMTTSGVRTLFNFNPLIKLDGYYLLGDYLEIPNLRKRSFSYLSARIRRLWGSAIQDREQPTPRERRIYLIYGLSAGTFSFSLLGFMALNVGDFLVGRYQAAGFILFLSLLIVVFRSPLKKALHALSAPFRPRQGMFVVMKRLAKILVFFSAVLAVLFLVTLELKISGEFKIQPLENTDVRAEVEGIIQTIYVEEGDVVNKGDPIASLFDRDYRAELQKIEAAIDEKQANLKMLKMGPRQEALELARKEAETAKTRWEHALRTYHGAKRVHAEHLSRAAVSVDKAKERLKHTNSQRDRARALSEQQLVARKDLEEAEEQVAVRTNELNEAEAEVKVVVADDLTELQRLLAVSEKELEEAKSKLRVFLAGSRPEEIEAAEAEIGRLNTQRDYFEEQLRLVRLVSPISGVITTPKLKLREEIGQYVRRGDLIAEVHELKTVIAEIAISEKDISDVKIDQNVVIKARAYPGKSFHGSVTSIASTATKEAERLGGMTILVNTQIDNPSLLLKPDMTGNAKIYCGKQRIFDLMTRRLVRYIRVEFWSWW